jgi:pyruvyltransferase
MSRPAARRESRRGMSTIQTFFWHDRVRRPFKVYWDRYLHDKPWNDFVFGNAGDIFTRNVLTHFYPGTKPLNTSAGPRILCVGSISHKLQAGDILSGIGCASTEVPTVSADKIHIHALRGPISFHIFKAAGYDVSQVRFLADPGLLIGRMVPRRSAIKGQVAFVPHYRERKEVRNKIPRSIRLIDVDSPPLRLAKQLQRAECVYSSSLHGIIFAHSLGRPCVFVRPQTKEPLLKYEDYFLSVGLSPPTPLDSIADADFASAPTSPPALSVDLTRIVFPDEEELKSRGILRSGS